MVTTFAATLPDGTTTTRMSAERTYTHCIAIQMSSGAWYATSWAGRPDLAMQAARRINGRAIEATVAHVTTPSKTLNKTQIHDILEAAGWTMSLWCNYNRQYTVFGPGGSWDDEASHQHLTLAQARKLALSFQT